MHGGTRDKRTRWWCSDHLFDSLAILCSKDHPHASWRPRISSTGETAFPTHDEAAYPDLLCDRIASWLCEAYPQISVSRPRPMTHALLDRQPRYARPLVSNFSGYDTWAVPLGRHDWSALIGSLYPKGARVTRRKLVPWGHVRVYSLLPLFVPCP